MLVLLTIGCLGGMVFACSSISSMVYNMTPDAPLGDFDAYMIRHRKLQLRIRELHILHGVTIGIATGLLNCLFSGGNPAPVLIAFSATEVSWLLLTYVFWRPQEQRYFEARQLLTACGIGIALGVLALPFGISGTVPLGVGVVCAVVGFGLLTPL